MRDTKSAEGLAWRRLQTPAPRGNYQHSVAYKRRERKRATFRTKVKLTGSGCWVWSGGHAKGPNGKLYPIFNHYRASTPDNTTRAAFNWMMREWFPAVKVRSYAQTENRCGTELCINPYHRQVAIPNGGAGQERMDHDKVRAIWTSKGNMTQAEAASAFEVHTSTIARIWSGERWSSITGARYEPSPRMTADRARAIYSRRNDETSMQAVADRFGCSRSTVRSIWLGHTWASATGAARTDRSNRVSEETKELIRERMGRLSAAKTGREFGVASSTVLRIWASPSLSREQAPC